MLLIIVLKSAYRGLRFDRRVKSIPETRSIKAQGVHWIRSASEWYIQVFVRPGVILVNVINIGEVRWEGTGKKIISIFVHKDTSLKFVNIDKC